MAKMLHNLINAIVDLGGGLRLQPRGTPGGYVNISDELAKSGAVSKMAVLKKVRLMSLEEHAQYLRVLSNTSSPVPVPEATPAPVVEPKLEEPKEEPKKEETKEETPSIKEVPVVEEEDEPTKSRKSRKKKSRRKD